MKSKKILSLVTLLGFIIVNIIPYTHAQTNTGSTNGSTNTGTGKVETTGYNPVLDAGKLDIFFNKIEFNNAKNITHFDDYIPSEFKDFEYFDFAHPDQKISLGHAKPSTEIYSYYTFFKNDNEVPVSSISNNFFHIIVNPQRATKDSYIYVNNSNVFFKFQFVRKEDIDKVCLQVTYGYRQSGGTSIDGEYLSAIIESTCRAEVAQDVQPFILFGHIQKKMGGNGRMDNYYYQSTNKKDEGVNSMKLTVFPTYFEGNSVKLGGGEMLHIPLSLLREKFNALIDFNGSEVSSRIYTGAIQGKPDDFNATFLDFKTKNRMYSGKKADNAFRIYNYILDDLGWFGKNPNLDGVKYEFYRNSMRSNYYYQYLPLREDYLFYSYISYVMTDTFGPVKNSAIDWSSEYVPPAGLDDGGITVTYNQCALVDILCHIGNFSISLKSSFSSLTTGLKNMFTGIAGGFMDGVKSIFDWIGQKINSIFGPIFKPIYDFIMQLIEEGKIIFEKLKTFFNETFEIIKNLFKGGTDPTIAHNTLTPGGGFRASPVQKLLCDKKIILDKEGTTQEDDGVISFVTTYLKTMVSSFSILDPIAPTNGTEICTYEGIKTLHLRKNSFVDIIIVMIFSFMSLFLFYRLK